MILLLLSMGCGDKATDTAKETESTVESTFEATENRYEFINASGVSSVAYSGQTYRQLLIHDLDVYISELANRVLTESIVSGQVETDLLFYLESIKELDGDFPHLYTVENGTLLQSTYADVSSGKNLFEKLAGNDTVTDHKDWSTQFYGWGEDGVSSPESLVRTWCSQLDAQASGWGAISNQTPHVYVSRDGVDYRQLLSSFLYMSVAFSQGTDDYLDDDVDGKGLLSSHVPEEGSDYSALEHAWDEGFGYFGASIDYIDWSSSEVVNTPAMDRDGDGSIDLISESTWGAAIWAAQYDALGLGTTLSKDAWQAFWSGRALLHDTVGSELTEEQRSQLLIHRDQAVQAWERVVVLTIVQAIDDTIQAIESEAELSTLAHHWSRVKGLSMGLQFNPDIQLGTEAFVAVQDAIGQSPKTGVQYLESLQEIKTLFIEAYTLNQ